MKILYTATKQQYEISDEQAAAAAKAMANDGILHLKDHGVIIKGSAIMEIQDKPERPVALPPGQYHDPAIGKGAPDLPEPTPEEFARQRKMMDEIRKKLMRRK